MDVVPAQPLAGVVPGQPLADGVVLGYLEPYHATQFLAHLDNGVREHLAPTIPFVHRVTDLASTQAYLQRWADNRARDTQHLFGLWHDGRLIGGVPVFNFDTTDGSCEIGVWIVPEYEGRGLVGLATRQVLHWVFRLRGIVRVMWICTPGNERSRALAQRLGFSREGVLRSASVVGGVRADAELWSLLASEWPPGA
jgi:ribosomal-protein-serine acetyltransferase